MQDAYCLACREYEGYEQGSVPSNYIWLLSLARTFIANTPQLSPYTSITANQTQHHRRNHAAHHSRHDLSSCYCPSPSRGMTFLPKFANLSSLMTARIENCLLRPSPRRPRFWTWTRMHSQTIFLWHISSLLRRSARRTWIWARTSLHPERFFLPIFEESQWFDRLQGRGDSRWLWPWTCLL